MDIIIETEVKGIYDTLHRYEQSEIGLNELKAEIKKICEVEND